MPKSRSRRDANLRRHLAYLAARLIAEDGVADFATAKWKAARQAGLEDANLLPDNREVEAALREYQGLFHKDDQPLELRKRRKVAIRVMRELIEFRPALVGSVLAGTANQYSDVNLQLYTDDAKALTLFLLNRRHRVAEGTRRVRRGDGWDDVPQIRMEVEGIPVTLTVLARDDERVNLRPRAGAEAPQRARLAEVEALLND